MPGQFIIAREQELKRLVNELRAYEYDGLRRDALGLMPRDRTAEAWGWRRILRGAEGAAD